ncbi:unnamed protein product [Gulo gulo]|uniref:Uncharacterized protein n=1 Tax=Gulo gulo TaxID=48420 RepID=A0A9X9LCQ5_GULGU|nr:unnamed protein product [Gulo gulo]
MLLGLPILGDTCFKFTNTSSNNQDSTVRLRCAYIMFLIKVSVSCGIILTGLEFPQGDINGDTTFMCSFQLIQDPRHTWRTSFPSQQPPSQIFPWFFCQSHHICRSDDQ